MSSIVRTSYSSRQTRTVGGVTRTEEKSVTETKSDKGGVRKEEKKITVEKDGTKVSEDKSSKEQKISGIAGRGGLRALKDANDNTIEVKVGEKKDLSKKTEAKTAGAKGAEAVIDLKAETAKRRQRTNMNIEQRMIEQKQRKAADQKKRIQGRQAFKAQLESNAPTRNGPNKSSFKRSADSNIEKLLRWTQNRTNGYPGVEISDFSSSWSDGLAFCALLHSLCPGEFPLDKMKEDDRKTNLDLAFDFAGEKGVPSLIDTEDILRSKNPEPKSMITYLHTIYKVLVADKAEAAKKEQEKDKEEEDKKGKDD